LSANTLRVDEFDSILSSSIQQEEADTQQFPFLRLVECRFEANAGRQAVFYVSSGDTLRGGQDQDTARYPAVKRPRQYRNSPCRTNDVPTATRTEEAVVNCWKLREGHSTLAAGDFRIPPVPWEIPNLVPNRAVSPGAVPGRCSQVAVPRLLFPGCCSQVARPPRLLPRVLKAEISTQ